MKEKHLVSTLRSTTRLFSCVRSLRVQQQQGQPTTPQATFKQPLTFAGNTTVEGTPEERMTSIFGGRIKGEGRVSSSRKETRDGMRIAGVYVPHKPTEPDNCCMSGCVNCVWEQYGDDLKDWRRARNKAVKAISETNLTWPSHFHPPLRKLDIRNIPRELRARKRELAKEKKVTTSSYFPVSGKPGAQNILKNQIDHDEVSKEEEDEDWENVPVAMRAFAKTEALLRKRRREKEMKASAAAREAKEKAAKADATQIGAGIRQTQV